MKRFRRLAGAVGVIVGLACGSAAVAQRPGANAVSAKAAASNTYNMANDVSLQGTVLKYTENSQTAPLGTHVTVQTANAVVEVHLGDARLLHTAKLNITPGANIRLIGQMGTAGAHQVFLARLVQLGTQVIAVRSTHGLPISAAGVRGNKALLASVQAEQKGGAR